MSEYGDKIHQKDEGNIWIGFQNINGLKGKIIAAHEVFATMEEKEMDILGVAETNINWSDTRRLEAKMAIKIRFGKGQMIATSRKTSKDGYLPEGKAMITRGRVTGRILKKGIDEMGLLTWMILKGKNNKQIMMITAYRVCKAGPNIGPHTAHMQQVKQLLLKGVVTPNPRMEMLL